MTDLKPCPVCGAAAMVIHLYDACGIREDSVICLSDDKYWQDVKERRP